MNIPWCEKYRPKLFENILLDESNKTFLNKILETNIFPNLLFYGPPGTGKSETIANIICHNLAIGRKVLFVAEKMAMRVQPPRC